MRIRSVRKLGITIFAAIAVLIALIFIILLLASGIFSKQRYLESWNKSYFKKLDDPRLQLAAHGLLAANGHNMQPWKIKLDENKNVFYLYSDSKRLTKEVDPFSRQDMITQGTFLEYARIAGDKLGYKTDIVLFPEGDYDENNLENSMDKKPVAKITLTKTQPKDNPLYDFMFLPDTNRSAYDKTKLNSEEIKQLEDVNTYENMDINIFQDEKNVAILKNYAIEGAKIESSLHRMNVESANVFRPNEAEKNKYRYGYSVEGQGTSGIMKYILQGLVTIFPSFNDEKASANTYVKSTEMEAENTSTYALIISKDNTRKQQVESGMIYSRFVLQAHALGYVMQPLSQVLEEYPEMKQQYTGIHSEYASEGGTIQMFLRLGKTTKEVPQTMRRDVMDLVK
ncbi:hypothetical protein IAI10_13605 [Clostridium sp. 19966]|uniref:Acg family FMN-binding oxidoreductase n=1 Tax=Clostridium sp. 19966 TaxID=2768166 RepID=UPI0028DFBAD7|nr:hypothetical protein [Clostridium sp. 19966]MDT8717700.1 hypothetical protein [Clostridium sp. 19966]